MNLVAPRILFLIAIISVGGFVSAANPTLSAHLLSVKKIWDRAPHNAFTDLIRFKSRWYCVFREGDVHAKGEGKLRVLVSKDGEAWESAALIEEKGRDLRDAKFAITPDRRLMLNGGSADPADHSPKGSFYSVVSFSKDGRAWGPLRGSSYQPKALLMQSSAPYTGWAKKELTADVGGDQIGGPAILRVPDGGLIGAGRRFSDKPSKEQRTGLFLIDAGKATLTNLLMFPSGGDTSYPGLVWYNNQLWISYYSSHEEKSSIYLAKIELKRR